MWAVETFTSILEELGFLLNAEKSELNPTKQLTWLGATWASQDLQIRVPSEMVMKIVNGTKSLLIKQTASKKEFRSLLGSMAFAS